MLGHYDPSAFSLTERPTLLKSMQYNNLRRLRRNGTPVALEEDGRKDQTVAVEPLRGLDSNSGEAA